MRRVDVDRRMVVGEGDRHMGGGGGERQASRCEASLEQAAELSVHVVPLGG